MTSSLVDYTAVQQHIVDALRVFLGEEAAPLYDAHGRSLQQLVHFARDSELPGCRRLTVGLSIAQALLAETMTCAPVLDSPSVVSDFLKLQFAGQPFESFVVLFLDTRHGLIATEEVFRGTLAQTSVYPREVVKRALHHNAGAVILAHNHPSGSTEPSQADRVLTESLKATLALVDVRVVDHLVVAGSRSLSFAQRGLL